MESFIIYPLAALFLVLALVVYFGKGDWLIAGYNTASEKERAQYNIKRLRLIIALLLLLSVVFVVVLLHFPYISIIATPIFVVITLIGVVLANTWAKK
jgi:archaellum biogenesis protein FlaJ (TadC family)